MFEWRSEERRVDAESSSERTMKSRRKKRVETRREERGVREREREKKT